MKPVVRTYKVGVYLFHENDHSRELYLIQSGSVRIFRTVKNRVIELGVMGKGSILGEMALIDGRPRSASARVVDACTATIIDPETFDSKIRGVPPWFFTIVRMISQKIRSTHKHLENLHADERGINAILALQYFLHKSAGSEAGGQCLNMSLHECTTRLAHLTAIGPGRIAYILDVLHGNSFLSISGDVLECTALSRLDRYCEFLRFYLRKSFEKFEQVDDAAGRTMCALCDALQPPLDSSEDILLRLRHFREIVQKAGIVAPEENLLGALNRIFILKLIRSIADDDNLLKDREYAVNGRQLYMYAMYFTFLPLVPTL